MPPAPPRTRRPSRRRQRAASRHRRCGRTRRTRDRRASGAARCWPPSGRGRSFLAAWHVSLVVSRSSRLLPRTGTGEAATSLFRHRARRARRASAVFRQPWPLPARVTAGQGVRLLRPPRPPGVRDDLRRVVEQRLHDPPGLLDAILPREKLMIAGQASVQQPLVRFERLAQFGGERGVEVDRAPRAVAVLGGDLQPQARVGVDAQHDLVRLHLLGRGQEGEPGGAPQQEPHLGDLRRHRLAGAQEDRHARPAPVVDLQPEGRERLGGGPARHTGDIQVALVLAADVACRVGGWHRAEHLGLLVPQVVRARPGRRVHRDEREHLQQVILHHVTQRPDGVVEPAAVFHAEILGHRDLDGGHALAVPQLCEPDVGEAQVLQLDDRFLAEEVVDAQDLVLGQHLVQPVVEGAGGCQVVTERFLHGDPCAVQQARRGEVLDDRAEQRRRHLQVVQRPPAAADLRGEPGVQLAVCGIAVQVAQPPGEPPEHLLVERLAAAGDRVLGAPYQLLRGHLLARDADDPAPEQPAALQPVQRAERHLAGQVAGDAEDHQRVRLLAAVTQSQTSHVARCVLQPRHYPPRPSRAGRVRGEAPEPGCSRGPGFYADGSERSYVNAAAGHQLWAGRFHGRAFRGGGIHRIPSGPCRRYRRQRARSSDPGGGGSTSRPRQVQGGASRRGGAEVRGQGQRDRELARGEGGGRGKFRGHAGLASGNGRGPVGHRPRSIAADGGVYPAADTWVAAVHATEHDFVPLGAAVVIDDRRLLTCAHVVAGEGCARGPLWVAFPKAENVLGRRAVSSVVVAQPADVADLAVLVLDRPVPAGVTAAPLRCPRPQDLVGKAWWAFGFAGGDPVGNAVDGVVGASLGYGWVRLDTGSRYQVERGFSGSGLWSPDYEAVVGVVGQANDRGDARAITLYRADACLPEQNLRRLSAWSVEAAGELALAAWGWALETDPEAGRHWRPRARGVTVDSERGYRFRGRSAALTAITRWLDRPEPDRRVLVVTGSSGVGKSAVLGRVVTTADPGVAAELPPGDDAVRATLGSVACAVHAKGKTALEVAAEVARAASAALPDQVDDFAPAMRAALTGRGGERFNVIIDALDEAATAAQARLIARRIVLPLAETCSGVGAQVVVGTRRRDEGGDLLSVFGDAIEVIDLDDTRFFAREDLTAYATATLQLVGDKRPGNPYADPAIAARTAGRIAELSGRNFLVAGLIARAHGLHDTEAADPAELSFPATVDAALRDYLDLVAPVAGCPAESVLAALAFAEPPGLPIDLWREAIVALEIGR